MADDEHHRTLLTKAADYRARAKAATDSGVASALEAVAREYERLAAKLLLETRAPDRDTRSSSRSQKS
jgi:hypothetical protein